MRCIYFTDFIQAHIERSDPNRIFIDKLSTVEILKSAGAKAVTQYFILESIDEVDFNKLPDPVVLKLTNLSSKKGIYILYRIKGGYFEQLSRRLLTSSQIKEEIYSLTKFKKSPIIAEEVIVGVNGPLQIPYDYKLYLFDGVPEFILQINRNNKKDEIAFFDGNFKPMVDGRARLPGGVSVLGAHLLPNNYIEMMAAAKVVAKRIDRPFISIDMYSDGDKYWIGELTPTPGGPYYGQILEFSNDFDLYLGGILVKGYASRGWPIPEIEMHAPCRRV